MPPLLCLVRVVVLYDGSSPAHSSVKKNPPKMRAYIKFYTTCLYYAPSAAHTGVRGGAVPPATARAPATRAHVRPLEGHAPCPSVATPCTIGRKETQA